MHILKNYLAKISFCLLLLPTLPISCFQQDPLSELSLLITSTEDLVSKQKALRTHLSEYILLHDAYLLDMDNKELLLKTARVAKKVLNTIKNEKMTSLFESSFISELTLFAKMATNPSIPKI